MPNGDNRLLMGIAAVFILMVLLVPVVWLNNWWKDNHVADSFTTKLKQSIWITALTVVVSFFMALFVTAFIATLLAVIMPKGGAGAGVGSILAMMLLFVFVVSFFISLVFIASVSVYIYQNIVLMGYTLFLALMIIPLLSNLVLGVLVR